MPDIALDFKAARPITRLGHVPADSLGKGIVLEEPNCLGCETGAYEEQQAGGRDEEPVQGGRGAGAVDEPSDDSAEHEAREGGERDGRCGLVERHLHATPLSAPALRQDNMRDGKQTYTADKDHSL